MNKMMNYLRKYKMCRSGVKIKHSRMMTYNSAYQYFNSSYTFFLNVLFVYFMYIL